MLNKKFVGFLGAGGVVFAALCCVGTPALLAFLTAAGFGFLINDFILIPMLIFFMVLVLYGFSSSGKRGTQTDNGSTCAGG
ncbi:MAG: MerC domain-containing protein [Nitrospinota bacterium]